MQKKTILEKQRDALEELEKLQAATAPSVICPPVGAAVLQLLRRGAPLTPGSLREQLADLEGLRREYPALDRFQVAEALKVLDSLASK